MSHGILVLNFSHRLTAEQLEQISDFSGRPVVDAIDVPSHVDLAADLVPQACALVDASGISALEPGGVPVVVVLPALSVVAACVLAELHGRLGHFPSIAYLVRDDGPAVTFRVSGVIPLQGVRDRARQRR